MEFRGLSIASPVNRIKAGFCLIATNVRAYLRGAFMLRNRLSNAIYTLIAPVVSIARMNDATPQGPVSGYTIISVDSNGNLYNGATKVATGLSGNPVSLAPFQPNQSVQPWCYVGDSSQTVSVPYTAHLTVKPALTATSVTGWVNASNALSTTLYTFCPGLTTNSLNINAAALSLPTGATVTGVGISGQAYNITNGGNLSVQSNPGNISSYPSVLTVPGSIDVGGPTTMWGMTQAEVVAGFQFLILPDTFPTQIVYVNNVVVTVYYDLAKTTTCTGMVKVRSDGLTRKTGIKEPQSPPLVGINTVNVTEWLTLAADTPPWTNIAGVNANYNYTGTDDQPPYPAIIATPVAGSTVTLTVSGTATVNGASHTPGDSGPATSGYPGAFITTPKIVVFAFTDANGNIIAQATGGTPPPVVGNVGASATLIVPSGAAQLQLGVNSQGGAFSANSGSFLVQAVVSTSAITQVSSIVGLVTASVWGDSPQTGPVAGYIWRNPNDGGTGISRTIGTAQATASNNSLIFDSTPEDGTVPVLWSTLNSVGSVVGSIDLFSPALESAGYQDFNACITGSLFVPTGGTYAISLQYKDQIMFGMGGGATSTGGAVYGFSGQAITVADGLPLLFVSTIDGTGSNHTTSINVTFPAMGIYPFEIDWDYWYHTGRTLQVKMAPTPGTAVAVLPPLPQGVRTGVQYWGKYRASETGAQSNPSQPSPLQLTPVLANTIQLPYSDDPQVDKVDYYRQDNALANPTYVATGPNDAAGGTINGVIYNTAIEDTLDDLAAGGNQIMAEDDFEPFPSIDTPKSGMVTIVGGVITWISGDKFDSRWLPGTLMLIGWPTQMAYSLVARPISATQIVIPTVPDTIGDFAGNGVVYNIAQPVLAQTPVPYLFGPTDNIPFICGVTGKDGVIRWCKGNNLDSAPETNQQNLTDPSEILVNGAMSSGYAIVFSIRRAWIMVPNFFNAEATATGTSGSTWSFRSTEISRGLFIPRCLAVEGSGKTFFRVDDGWHFSQSGQGSVSITDETMYTLFPHEGSTPTAIVRNGVTVYPPDDTLPQLQQASIVGPYLYWDYRGVDANPHTLVFDINVMAWVWDATTPKATVHAANQGPNTQGVLVGCTDFTIRQFSSTGSESVTGTVMSGAMGSQGYTYVTELALEYSSTSTITLTGVVQDAGNGSYGPAAITLPATGGKATKYFVRPSANKFKWLSWQFQFSDPTAQVYMDGCSARMHTWGGDGALVQMFGEQGGLG